MALASPLTLNSKTDIWPVCNANFVPLHEMMKLRLCVSVRVQV